MAHRKERLNTLIRQELSDLLRRQVKDPRLGGFITIIEVATSPDLKSARVFVSHLGSEEEKRQILSGLAAASGFLRNEMAKRLKLRSVPELRFQWDDSIERGTRLIELMDQLTTRRTPDRSSD